VTQIEGIEIFGSFQEPEFEKAKALRYGKEVTYRAFKAGDYLSADTVVPVSTQFLSALQSITASSPEIGGVFLYMILHLHWNGNLASLEFFERVFGRRWEHAWKELSPHFYCTEGVITYPNLHNLVGVPMTEVRLDSVEAD
jgi:hypothetical protein